MLQLYHGKRRGEETLEGTFGGASTWIRDIQITECSVAVPVTPRIKLWVTMDALGNGQTILYNLLRAAPLWLVKWPSPKLVLPCIARLSPL